MPESTQEHLQTSRDEKEKTEARKSIEKKPAKSEDRIQMGEFYGIYPQEEINRDINAVIRKREKLKLKNAEFGEDISAKKMEAGVVCRAVNAFRFFGEHVHVMRASLWDDYFRGVDAIAEIEIPGEKNSEEIRQDKKQFSALSIDATKTFSRLGIKEKIENNLRVLEGRGQEVKYGKSFDGKFKGKLTDILPVVLCLDGKNVDNFFAKMEALVEAGQNKTKDPSQENDLVYRALYLELMRDPIQLTMIKEIIMQVEYYQNYFKDNEKVMRKYKSIFIDTLNVFKGIKEIARKKTTSILASENDRAFKIIKDICGKTYTLAEHEYRA